MLRYIIFAPLVGAAINWLIGRRLRNSTRWGTRSETFSGYVACLAVAVSTLFAFIAAFKSDGALNLPAGVTRPVVDHLWRWISVGGFTAEFGLAMDRLSGIYTLFVTFVGLLIHIFAVGYMHGDKGFYRFFAYMNLFMFSMLTLVLADNLLLMFVGWEGVGLCSYLLIGFYFDRQEAGDAAKKAFIVNRIGDWGMILGIILIFMLTGSISFFDSVGGESALHTVASMPVEPFTAQALIAGGITSAALLLFIGAIGKSAQIPLFVWLPDAMAGPTPVSALIHAATMVTAGVYMVVRCSTIYTHAPSAMFIIAIIGVLTALVGATIGLAQNDIKKVLAYSTISQLGYMMLACGVGAFVAAIFHVMTHAFFKALLFLGSGSVIHGMHDEQDMRLMGGLHKYMPITFGAMLAGWLAICGIPIFAGFFSKDEILWRTWSTMVIPAPYGKLFWIVAAFTALLTAIYMTRMMVMTFWGTPRYDTSSHHSRLTPHESPAVMYVPLIILALLSVFGGLIGVPYALSSGAIPNVFERTLEPVIAQYYLNHHEPMASEVAVIPHRQPQNQLESQDGNEEVRAERFFIFVSILIAVTGLGLGWALFHKKPLRIMPKILERKYYVDEIYDFALVKSTRNISREGLWKLFDLELIDGIVNGIGRSMASMGALFRYIQSGFVRGYAAIILLGALALIGYFTYYAVQALGLR